MTALFKYNNTRVLSIIFSSSVNINFWRNVIHKNILTSQSKPTVKSTPVADKCHKPVVLHGMLPHVRTMTFHNTNYNLFH